MHMGFVPPPPCLRRVDNTAHRSSDKWKFFLPRFIEEMDQPPFRKKLHLQIWVTKYWQSVV